MSSYSEGQIHNEQVAKFPLFMEIEVGGKSRTALISEMEAKGMVVAYEAREIMVNSNWKTGKKETVQFACASVGDLGFTQRTTTAEVWNRIKVLGHSLCEPCDGPAIRLALNKPIRGYLLLAMEQIPDSENRPKVFILGRGPEGDWLGGGLVKNDSRWAPNEEFAFRLRK